MKEINLASAEKYFRLGKYSKVIRYLEPQVFNYRENEKYYNLLGMSCLFMGDYSGANSYLRRSLQINNLNEHTLLGLAVIHLKHNNSSEAIRLWLDILDRNNKNKYAKKGLDLLKKSGSLNKLPEDFVNRNLSRLVPGKKNVVFYRMINFSLKTAAAAALIAVVFFTGKLFYSSFFDKNSNILPELSISRNINELTEEGDHVFIFTAKEVVETFENAKKLFASGEDNLSRIEINRILYSNASEDVKEKARLLSSYLREPDFRYFQNTIQYRDVRENPLLYNNCHVKWSGKIANIKPGKDSAVFDFLIGYDTGRVLEGIITVKVDFPVMLDEEFTYDIIGKLSTESDIIMNAVSVRNYIR